MEIPMLKFKPRPGKPDPASKVVAKRPKLTKRELVERYAAMKGYAMSTVYRRIRQGFIKETELQEANNGMSVEEMRIIAQAREIQALQEQIHRMKQLMLEDHRKMNPTQDDRQDLIEQTLRHLPDTIDRRKRAKEITDFFIQHYKNTEQ